MIAALREGTSGLAMAMKFAFDQQGNIAQTTIPVMQLDMWEHAFYLDYLNVKADYVKAFWNIANWTDADERFTVAREKTEGLLLLS